MATTAELDRAFRFKQVFEGIEDRISRATSGNLPAAALYVERAVLNLEMMRVHGIAYDRETHRVVAAADEDDRLLWLSRLTRNLAQVSTCLLAHHDLRT